MKKHQTILANYFGETLTPSQKSQVLQGMKIIQTQLTDFYLKALQLDDRFSDDSERVEFLKLTNRVPYGEAFENFFQEYSVFDTPFINIPSELTDQISDEWLTSMAYASVHEVSARYDNIHILDSDPQYYSTLPLVPLYLQQYDELMATEFNDDMWESEEMMIEDKKERTEERIQWNETISDYNEFVESVVSLKDLKKVFEEQAANYDWSPFLSKVDSYLSDVYLEEMLKSLRDIDHSKFLDQQLNFQN